MSEAGERATPAAAEEAPNPHKRRRIRKGTQSCWECKRRKIRCTFASPAEGGTCDGCKSRGTRCLGQEYEESSSIKGSFSRGGEQAMQLPHLKGGRRSALQTRTSDSSLPTPASGPDPGPDPETQLITNRVGVCRALREAWPSKPDLDQILDLLVDFTILTHGVVCAPYSEYSKQLVPPQTILEPRPEDSHPVLVAKKLLMLATLIQAIPLSSPAQTERLTGLAIDFHLLESRLVNTASRLVTSNDDLVSGSLDGIECVMMESMYHNNAGSLRHAWLVNRKAMLLAQMMSLHTITAASLPCNVLERETRDRIDPEYMWFRLVCTDRYLSLMLGLPQGSPGDTFASPEALERCGSSERMERLMTVAGGMILQRHSPEGMGQSMTRKVDELLKEAAALMPPKWWLVPKVANTGNDAGAFEETLRLMNQFAYHHLLVQLHLPYILQLSSPNRPDYEYSKMTAIAASRSILELFVSFRTSTSATAYCRGVDFVAFVASTTLFLGHIEARRHRPEDAGVTAFQSIQHQRLGDRGLLEQTLEIMGAAAQKGDGVARKITSILRPLLAIEDDAAQGRCYHATYSSTVDADGSEQESEDLGGSGEAPATLQIEVPHFGTVKIQHQSPARGPSGGPSREPTSQASGSTSWNLPLATGECYPAIHEASSTPQAGDEITADTGLEALPRPSPDQLGVFLSRGQWAFDAYDAASGAEEHDTVPGLDAGMEDWALQGVDMALFNNLLQSSSDEAYPGLGTGTQS